MNSKLDGLAMVPLYSIRGKTFAYYVNYSRSSLARRSRIIS